MNRRHVCIFAAYFFHAVSFVLAVLLMPSLIHSDALIIAALIWDGCGLAAWIAACRKSYMPWTVYGHFWVGTVCEILLLLVCGIVPDAGGTAGALLLAVPNAVAVAAYDGMIAAYALLLGLVNLVLRALHSGN